MKRYALDMIANYNSGSEEDYFSSDGEGDAILERAYNRYEQHGGAVGGPLFAFEFQRVGPRRRWRNTVQGQNFHANITQLRAPHDDDDLGVQLTEALHRAMERELESLDARASDTMTFTMQSPDYNQVFESRTLEVGEFLQRTRRVDELFQHLAEKLNSNESLDVSRGFEVCLSRRFSKTEVHCRFSDSWIRCLDLGSFNLFSLFR